MATDTPKKTVLVVDDEPDFAALVESVLRGQGFDVRLAQDGEEALSRVREKAPDLITLDIQMPRKTGLLFYRQLRTITDYRGIPVIVISGLTKGDRDMDTFIRAFLEANNVPPPNAYLEKPITSEDLVRLVDQIVHVRTTP